MLQHFFKELQTRDQSSLGDRGSVRTPQQSHMIARLTIALRPTGGDANGYHPHVAAQSHHGATQANGERAPAISPNWRTQNEAGPGPQTTASNEAVSRTTREDSDLHIQELKLQKSRAARAQQQGAARLSPETAQSK